MLRIVATPEELDACQGWWGGKEGQSGKWDHMDRQADRWLQPGGYVAEEVKRALRRTSLPAKCPGWKKGKDGRWSFVGAPLPLPTLAGESKRLAHAIVEDDDGFYAAGPRAAEQWVKYRREQLGLSNDWDEGDKVSREEAA